MNGCSRKRDPEFAERAYRKALQLNPYFSFAHVRLMSYLSWAGREDDALREVPTHSTSLR